MTVKLVKLTAFNFVGNKLCLGRLGKTFHSFITLISSLQCNFNYFNF